MTCFSDCKVNIISDSFAFSGLKDTWGALLERAPNANPFLSFEWMDAWWSAYSKDCRLRVVHLTDCGRSVALVPLVYRTSLLAKHLEFMASERSDYLGFISEKSLTEILPSVLGHLSREDISWDYVKLSNLALSEGELESIVSQVAKSGYRSCARLYTMAPFLSISGSWDNYLNSLGKEQNKKIRKKEKRLLSKGNIEIVKCVEFVSEDKRIGNVFQTARRIELLGWKYREGSQRIQTDDRSEKFFEKFLRGFADRGWLESWFVLNDGNPIAYAFNFLMDGRVYAYNSSFDERYREMGPGALLHIFRIRDAHERGRKEYDFLRGLESYKSEWTSCQRKLFELYVFNRPTYATYLVRNAIQFRNRLAGSESLRAIRARILGWKGKWRKHLLPKGKDAGSERPEVDGSSRR